MNTLRKHGFVAKKYNSLFFAYLLGWVVSLIGSLSDSVLAGMLISEDAVAAVELVTPLFNILMFFATLIGIGVSTLFSTYLGAFDKEKAAKVNGMGLIISVAAGVLFTVLMFVFKDAYFAFYGSGGMSKAKAILLTALSGVPTILGAVLGYLLGGLGQISLLVSLGLASGAMLYVILGELLPEAILMYKSKLPALLTFIGILVGFALVNL